MQYTWMFRECSPDYPYDLDVAGMFHEWEQHKIEDITTYRDKSFPSKFTGGHYCTNYFPRYQIEDLITYRNKNFLR
jgi:hypothetical protein